MTPNKTNRAPLMKRINVLALTATAAIGLTAFTPTIEAAHVAVRLSREYGMLAVALNGVAPGKTIETATADELAAAVTQAIGTNPRVRPGLFAGEALKHAGSNAGDAGDEIGEALAQLPGDAIAAAADAIKRAGSGRDLNVDLVPSFAIEFVDTEGEAFDLAKRVRASKAGTGAVLGGYASTLATEQDMRELLNKAIASPRLGGAGLIPAVQDITKFIVAEVDADGGDTAEFTRSVAVPNARLAPKIAAGGVAGDPMNGGAIVDSLLSEDQLPLLKRGVIPLVNGVGKVADIEEISKIAIAVGKQIATPIGRTTAIKFGAAAGVVRSLARAIATKTTGTDDIDDRNRYLNKQDEIAEVAAYMVGQILNEHTINGTGGGRGQVSIRNAGAKIFALVMAAVTQTKSRRVSDPGQTLYRQTAQDVAGSVASTLNSLKASFDEATVPDAFFDNIVAFLVKKATAIGGRPNQQLVVDAINNGYSGSGEFSNGSNPDFEDGTILANAQTSDPETDIRPF